MLMDYTDIQDEEDEVTSEAEVTTSSDEKPKFVRNENPLDGETLSKLDIQALREASALTFIYESSEAKIIARKEKDDPTYGKAVLERTIDQVDGVVRIYDPSAREPKSAAVVINGDSDTTWQTIAEFLREGDQITLVFRLGVPNEVLDNAGITRDNFSLEVKRWDGRGRGALRTFEYHVSDVFGTDESNRMFSWE
jgi:hypothetical protein